MTENKEKWKHEDHNFNGRLLHYPVCINCGLIMMKNEFSQWAIRMGCNNKEHPRYDTVRHELTNLDRRIK